MGGVGLFSRDFLRNFSLLAGHVGNTDGSTGKGDSCRLVEVKGLMFCAKGE